MLSVTALFYTMFFITTQLIYTTFIAISCYHITAIFYTMFIITTVYHYCTTTITIYLHLLQCYVTTLLLYSTQSPLIPPVNLSNNSKQ